MSDFIEVCVIVEGRTEEIFIKKYLAEYLAEKRIYMTPIQISKPGQKGGDVRFARAIRDIELHLKQRSDTYVSLFVDYYGLGNDWPGKADARDLREPVEIAKTVNDATHAKVNSKLSVHRSDTRFIPHLAVHEFESLLFSESASVAEALGVEQNLIEEIIDEFGDPEKINNSPATVPSKRLEQLNDRFKKTTTGIAIAERIGIPRMREKCKVFDSWLLHLEGLVA